LNAGQAESGKPEENGYAEHLIRTVKEEEAEQKSSLVPP
jgi:hypothetical protein